MKPARLLTTAFFTLIFSYSQAQNEIPKGYSKGTIVLSDSSIVSGYIKEKIRSNASVTLINGDNRKRNYDGSDLLSAEIDGEKFLCIKGDFFRIVTGGGLMLVQKSSDASRKPLYNGNQPVFANGTTGSPGDYFFYNISGKQLTAITKKSLDTIVSATFAGCTEAMVKAKNAEGDIAQLGEAVTSYNNCNKKTTAMN
jgi:hypothetical protein